MDTDRPLTLEEAAYVENARAAAFTLYEGKRIAHRSCGIAIAETFKLATPAYQSLRRGGITGEGSCGAIRGGEQALGELLGDPDPAGPVTPALRNAIEWYQRAWRVRVDRGSASDIICNNLTGQFGDFSGEPRKQFCTGLAATVAELVAEALVRFGDVNARPALTTLVGALHEN